MAPATPSPTLPTAAPTLISARFTLELEFVLCLANPYYLQYLAQTYPHLLNNSSSATHKPSTTNSLPLDDSDASRFARYLGYLYSYWRTPEYSKYLTHPGAVLRNLELLQQEQFRRDIIRPDVIGRLLEVDHDATVHTGEDTVQAEPVNGIVVQEVGEAMDVTVG